MNWTINARSFILPIQVVGILLYNIGWNYAHLGMIPESLELFERVDALSDSGVDASIWLDELKRIEPQNGKLFLATGLSSVCEQLIPSRMRIQRFVH